MKANESTLNHKDLPRRGGTPEDLARNMEGVKSQLDELGGRIEDLEKAGQDNKLENVPAMVDAVKGDVRDLRDAMSKVGADYGEALKALTERLDTVDNQLAMNVAAKQVKTVGQVVLDSKGFKSAYLDAGGKLKSRVHLDRAEPIIVPAISGAKATIFPVSLTEMGDAVAPVYRPGIISDPQEVMNLAARMMRVPVPGANSYVVRKETAASLTGYITTTLAADIDGDPTPTNTCEFTDVDGFVAGTYVRFWNASGVLLGRKQIVSINTSTKVVTFAADDLDFDATTGWRVTGENFGAIPESGDKPFGYLQVDATEHSMKTIPQLLGVTEQVLSSVDGMTAWMEGKLRNRFRRNLSWHLLKGDGTASNQLAGFDNETGAQSYAWSSGVSGDFMVDAIFRAAALVPWSGAIAVVMNKADLVKIQLEKNSTDGRYVQTQMFGNVAVNMFGGRVFLGPYEIIIDDACVEGDFYVINLSEASELADAQAAQLRWGYIDSQFAQNQITARYEERMLHAINSTAAFVLGEWDSAPS